MNTFWIAFSLLAFAVFKEPCMLTGRPGPLNDASAELENNYSDWNYYCRNNFPSEANLSRPFPILLSFFLLSFPSFPDFSWFSRFLTLFFFVLLGFFQIFLSSVLPFPLFFQCLLYSCFSSICFCFLNSDTTSYPWLLSHIPHPFLHSILALCLHFQTKDKLLLN